MECHLRFPRKQACGSCRWGRRTGLGFMPGSWRRGAGRCRAATAAARLACFRWSEIPESGNRTDPLLSAFPPFPPFPAFLTSRAVRDPGGGHRGHFGAVETTAKCPRCSGETVRHPPHSSGNPPMGHRCCANSIYGPPLRSAGPAEQQRCPTDAVAARVRRAELPATPGLSAADRIAGGPGRANCRSCRAGVHAGQGGRERRRGRSRPGRVRTTLCCGLTWGAGHPPATPPTPHPHLLKAAGRLLPLSILPD